MAHTLRTQTTKTPASPVAPSTERGPETPSDLPVDKDPKPKNNRRKIIGGGMAGVGLLASGLLIGSRLGGEGDTADSAQAEQSATSMAPGVNEDLSAPAETVITIDTPDAAAPETQPVEVEEAQPAVEPEVAEPEEVRSYQNTPTLTPQAAELPTIPGLVMDAAKPEHYADGVRFSDDINPELIAWTSATRRLGDALADFLEEENDDALSHIMAPNPDVRGGAYDPTTGKFYTSGPVDSLKVFRGGVDTYLSGFQLGERSDFAYDVEVEILDRDIPTDKGELAHTDTVRFEVFIKGIEPYKDANGEDLPAYITQHQVTWEPFLIPVGHSDRGGEPLNMVVWMVTAFN